MWSNNCSHNRYQYKKLERDAKEYNNLFKQIIGEGNQSPELEEVSQRISKVLSGMKANLASCVQVRSPIYSL